MLYKQNTDHAVQQIYGDNHNFGTITDTISCGRWK